MAEKKSTDESKNYFQIKGKNAEKVVHDLAEKTFFNRLVLP